MIKINKLMAKGLRSLHENEKGMTILEVAVVLGVLGLLAAFVIQSSQGVFTSAKISSAQESISQLYSAALACWAARGKTDFTGISVQELVNNNCLPASFTGVDANPWGGAYTVAANGTNSSRLDISLGKVPSDAGQTLREAYNQKASSVSYDAGSQTLKVTF